MYVRKNKNIKTLSEDIRKIDKVKNFKQFVNKNSQYYDCACK